MNTSAQALLKGALMMRTPLSLTLLLALPLLGAACGTDAGPAVTAGYSALGPGEEPVPPEGDFEVIDHKDSVNTGRLPENCVKLEAEDLCKAYVLYYFGSNEVSVNTWFEKPGEDECYGFYFDLLKAPALVSVKAGRDVYVGEIDSADPYFWASPAGSAGKGISNVVFCELPGDDDPCKSGSDKVTDGCL